MKDFSIYKIVLVVACALITACGVASGVGTELSDNPPVTPPFDTSVETPAPMPDIPLPEQKKNLRDRIAGWEKKDCSDMIIAEKPEVAEGMDVTFINAGETVLLPDGRSAELMLFIYPDEYTGYYEGEVLHKFYDHYEFVFRLDDELYVLDLEYSLSANAAYVIYISDEMILLVGDRNMPGHFATYKMSKTGDDVRYYQGFIVYIAPGYVITETRTHFLGTHTITNSFTYDGLFNNTPLNDLYVIIQPWDIHDFIEPTELRLLINLDVYELNNELMMIKSVTLTAGTGLTPVMLSIEDFIIVRDADGVLYMIDGFKYPEGSGVPSIKGISVFELFDGLSFAGP
jgi:predicted small secreted protein